MQFLRSILGHVGRAGKATVKTPVRAGLTGLTAGTGGTLGIQQLLKDAPVESPPPPSDLKKALMYGGAGAGLGVGGLLALAIAAADKEKPKHPARDGEKQASFVPALATALALGEADRAFAALGMQTKVASTPGGALSVSCSILWPKR